MLRHQMVTFRGFLWVPIQLNCLLTKMWTQTKQKKCLVHFSLVLLKTRLRVRVVFLCFCSWVTIIFNVFMLKIMLLRWSDYWRKENLPQFIFNFLFILLLLGWEHATVAVTSFMVQIVRNCVFSFCLKVFR